MKHHALIIDDNVKNVVVLAQLLTDQNFGHIPVTNLGLLDSIIELSSDVSIVFVDLEMPGLSGYDVLTLLRSNPRFRDVPIVCHTVHVNEINAAYQRGFDGFISKPLDPDRFPEQLERILRNEPVWEAA